MHVDILIIPKEILTGAFSSNYPQRRKRKCYRYKDLLKDVKTLSIKNNPKNSPTHFTAHVSPETGQSNLNSNMVQGQALGHPPRHSPSVRKKLG